MAHDEPPSAERSDADTGELVVFATAGHVGPNVLGAGVFLAIVVGDGWISTLLLGGRTGAVLVVGVVIAVVIGAPALWLVNGYVERIFGWWRWRNRPLPAMRLTASGIDYSPAYAGEFPLHVSWAVPLQSAYRRGYDNTGFVWCLYSPIIEGLDALPSRIDRRWPLDSEQVRAEYRQMVREGLIDKHSPEQVSAALHLIYYGTPIALNPHYLSGSSLAAVDAFLRERTDGQCTFYPPGHPIRPTTRFRVY
jgi:hypothetical protein